MSRQMTIDLQNYRDRMGSNVPAGRYRVVVEDLDVEKSKAGNPMIILSLRVIGGDYDGATLVDRLTNTEKALFRIVAFMQAIGQPTPRKRLNIQLDRWVGKKLDVDVEDGEPYNGRVRSEIRNYIRIAKAQQASDTPLDALDEFDASAEDSSPEVMEDAQDVAEETSDDVLDLPEKDSETVDLDSIEL